MFETLCVLATGVALAVILPVVVMVVILGTVLLLDEVL